MSLFISFEGGEGSGKTTQAERLRRRLEEAGVPVVPVREPGSTPLGDYLRDWLKRQDRPAIPPASELLLFCAARAALVRDVIKPALKRAGCVVIADRYADSTMAYQGYGRRIPLADIAAMNRLASEGLMPDLTLLLDCTVADGLGRVDATPRLALEMQEESSTVRRDPEGTRRFEEEPMDFHERVRGGYLEIADREPNRCTIIDATGSEDDIGDEVWSHVKARLSSERDAVTEDLSLGAGKSDEGKAE